MQEEYEPGIDILPVKVAQGVKQIFIDWWGVEAGYGLPFWKFYQEEHGTSPWFSPSGVELTVGRPRIASRPIMETDEFGNLRAYSTLLFINGLYRLWYETDVFKGEDGAAISYMESEDGIKWRKPALGMIEINGSTANNIVYGYGPAAKGGETGAHGASVFIDNSARPSERYKMVHLGPSAKGANLSNWLYGAVSPDGIDWRQLDEPLMRYSSDTQSIGLFDESIGQYVLYVRGWTPQGKSGFGGRRVVKRTSAKEFTALPHPETVLAPGPEWDPWTDIYTNAYNRWPGAASAHVMLPALYHRNSDTLSLQLALSRDGISWALPDIETPIVPHEDPLNRSAIYAGCGLVPFAGGKWAFPVYVSVRGHNEYVLKEPGIYLTEIREDGFMAVEAPLQGEFYTYPMIFQGTRLEVNCLSHTGGCVRVEVLEVLPRAVSRAVEGFTLEDCEPLVGDCLYKTVRWKVGAGGAAADLAGDLTADLSRFEGKVVRLRFQLTRARIFGYRFE
jgi:hypothetical protein